MKKRLLLPILFVILAFQSGCGLVDRIDALGSQIEETNRRLANIEAATTKMAKAFP
jgi:hypothetical protein